MADFTSFTADELFEARKGQIAAREGAPWDPNQTPAWKSGWVFAVDTEIANLKPSWVRDLRDAIAPARDVEVAA